MKNPVAPITSVGRHGMADFYKPAKLRYALPSTS
jgi:hypothetical protein